MANTVTTLDTQNKWEDLMAEDPLFSPLVKGFFAIGYLLMAIGLTVLLTVGLFNQFEGELEPDGSETTEIWFGYLTGIGTILFAGGFVAGGLVVSKLSTWGRLALLFVAAFLLLGSGTSLFSFVGLATQ